MRTRLTGRLSLLFMSFAMLLSLPATAFADEVANSIDNNVDTTVETMSLSAGGANGSTKIYVVGTTQDDPSGFNGCNFARSGGTLELDVKSSNASVATVSPSRATISGCDVSNGANISVTPLSAGSTTITVEKRTQSTVGGNFILSTATFTVNVSGAAKQNQSIAFNQPAPKTYGAADFALGATASSNLPVSYSSSTTDVCTIVDGKVHVVSAGNCTVTATQAGNASYNSATPATGTFAINKADLTVVTNDQTKKFGEANPALTGSVNGLQYSDSITASRSTTADENSDVGAYPIAATLSDPGNKLDNYNVTNNGGTLTVEKAAATLSLNELGGHTYDGQPQGATVATSPAGLGGVSVTYDGGQTRPTDAGSYAVVASLDNPNYQAQDANDTLTIARKALSITASDDRREYGDPNPALTGVLSGDVAGDNISASYATAATEASDAGAYPIVPSLNDPNSRLSNYDVSKTDGTLTVTKAALGATAANAEKVYGDALGVSNLTGSVTGVKNGDPIKVSYFSAGAASTSDVGAYPIVPALDATAAVLANYHDPILTNGTLSVTKAPLVIKADDASRFYDDPNPVFTGSVVSGVKNGDVLNLSFTTTALQNSPVGTYAIVPEAGGAKVGNYLVRAHNGTLTIGSWTFKGFYQPVDMSGTLNTVKGGSTVPIKFELFKGTTELTDTASINQPLKAAKVACDTGATVDAIELVATGGTALRYDATGGQFIYNWKTPTAAGACYKVTITANDGSSQTASFKIK